MRNIKKRILSIALSAMFVCMSLGRTTFAAEPDGTTNAICYNVELTSEGINSVTDNDGNEINPAVLSSSISGYEQDTLSGNPCGVQVFVDASGWGGMGITIKASSSWSGYMRLDVLGADGSSPLTEKAVYSNGETKFNSLWHYTPSYYLFSFAGIPDGNSVYVQIWIYG
jgi:hypothetical protein